MIQFIFLFFYKTFAVKKYQRSFLKAIKKPGTYTQAQFDRAVEVCKYWIKLYKIPISNIVRHSDCSGDHVRGKGKGKRDPGAAFDWKAFKEALK